MSILSSPLQNYYLKSANFIPGFGQMLRLLRHKCELCIPATFKKARYKLCSISWDFGYEC